MTYNALIIFSYDILIKYMGNCMRTTKVTPMNGKMRRRAHSIPKTADSRNSEDFYTSPYSVKRFLDQQKNMNKINEELESHINLITKYITENKQDSISEEIKSMTSLIDRIKTEQYPEEFIRKCIQKVRKVNNRTLSRIIKHYES